MPVPSRPRSLRYVNVRKPTIRAIPAMPAPMVQVLALVAARTKARIKARKSPPGRAKSANPVTRSHVRPRMLSQPLP
ncbi:hypothetical protein D3C81_1841650 [compost metagenome]